jgi:hypothetical protein
MTERVDLLRKATIWPNCFGQAQIIEAPFSNRKNAVIITLESLPNQIPCLSTNWCRVLVEGAVVCLTTQQHESNLTMRLVGPTNISDASSVTICWETVVSGALAKTYRNDPQTTDFGAMALALLLTLELTDYTHFMVSRIGDGVDYWLQKDDEDDVSARLEISGIRRKTKKNGCNSKLFIAKSDHNLA